MVRNELFANGGNILHNQHVLGAYTHLINSRIMLLNPQTMGLDTLIVELSKQWGEI